MANSFVVHAVNRMNSKDDYVFDTALFGFASKQNDIVRIFVANYSESQTVHTEDGT